MNKLKNLRKEYNYTIYDMAKMLDITPIFYYYIENNKRTLYYELAIKIANIFNMKPDDIFYTKKPN